MSDENKLNVVDEEESIIGVETRENIHKKGLLHREIHVWAYTPEGEIIFQHRAKNKDTFPDLLDATVGGHVEIGESYIEAAIKELEEETGIEAVEDDLILIKKMKVKAHDKITGMTNNAIQKEYAYKYMGKVEDLRVEKGKALGFEAWPIDKLFNLSEEEMKKFIPGLLREEILGIFREIQRLNSKK